MMPESNSVSLGRILDALSGVALETVAGRPSLAVRVDKITIYDPDQTNELGHGSLVALTGRSTTSDLYDIFDTLHAADVRVVVLRVTGAPPPELVEKANESGLTVLNLSTAMSWTRAFALLHTLLGVGPGYQDLRMVGAKTSNDLFSFADSVSALVNAPITIEDTAFHVLSFSRGQGDIDQARIASVLDRQVPSEYVAMLQRSGVVRHLQHSDEPIWVPAGIAESELARVAVAVRSGDRYFGSLWAAVSSPMASDQDRAFRDAAKTLGFDLVQRQLHTDAERRINVSHVATLLRGNNLDTDPLRLNFGMGSATVLSLGLKWVHSNEQHQRSALLDTLEDSLAVHIAAIQPRSAVARIGDAVYAVLTTRNRGAEAEEYARSVALDFLKRIGSRLHAVVGIGRAAARADELSRARDDADRARKVLLAARGNLRVATFADVYVDYALQTFAFESHAIGVDPLAAIRRLSETGVQYIETLTEWLEGFGDVATASAALHVHPNTFRYRLRRVREILGLDLDDPDVRFRLLVQLRISRVPELQADHRS